MQDMYIRNLWRALVTRFLADITSQIQSNQTTRVTIFITFMILLVAIYVAFWIPLVSKITREVFIDPAIPASSTNDNLCHLDYANDCDAQSYSTQNHRLHQSDQGVPQ